MSARKLSERESAVLKTIMADMPSGSNGADLVAGVRTLLGSISPQDVTLAGVHQTAASLVRKDLAWRGESRPTVYQITEKGRRALAGTGEWQVANTMKAKTLGEMSPDERKAAINRAAAQLQDELQANSVAIGRVLEGDVESGREHQEVPAAELLALVAKAIIDLAPDTSTEDAADLAAKLLELVPWLADAARDYAVSADRAFNETTFWGAVQSALEEADPIDVPKPTAPGGTIAGVSSAGSLVVIAQYSHHNSEYDDHRASVIKTIIVFNALGGMIRTSESAKANEICGIAMEHGRADIPGGIVTYDADASWGPDGRNHGPRFGFNPIPSITHAQARFLLAHYMPSDTAAEALHALAQGGIGNGYQEYTAEIPELGRAARHIPMRLYYAGTNQGGPVYRASQAEEHAS